MRKILFIVCALFSISFNAQEIKWMSMQSALEAQAKKPKKIFMDVYTDWCGPCKILDKKTLKDKQVVKYVNDNFYAVKFNAEGKDEFEYKGNTFSNPNYKEGKKGRNSQHIFASSLKIAGYPTLAFFDEYGDYIFPITGFHTPSQLEIYLKMVATNDYKVITSQQAFRDYEHEFQTTFSD